MYIYIYIYIYVYIYIYMCIYIYVYIYIYIYIIYMRENILRIYVGQKTAKNPIESSFIHSISTYQETLGKGLRY